MKALIWFIVIFVVMGAIWFTNGGPQRASSNDPFIHQPGPIGEGGTYSGRLFPSLFPSIGLRVNSVENNDITNQLNQVGEDGIEIQNALQNSESNPASIYKDIVTLRRGRATSEDPDNEYVTIEISSRIENPIVLDGWRLRSAVTGSSVEIEGASYLPRLGGTNKEFIITAQPGDTLLVTTGRSPIGVSFRLNICTGYLEQFQNFSPSLPRQCPQAEDEIPLENAFGSVPNAFNSQCLDFIENIRVCKINTRDIPLDMQAQCRTFVTKDLNYNACIDKHNNEDNFYIDEWRIFLRRDIELWKDRREIIELIDEQNKVVDTLTY